MRKSQRLHEEYLRIRSQCAIVTAADRKYAPYMFNMLASLHANFPTHPAVYIFDLGMTRTQLKEISQVPWLKVIQVPQFVPHWKANWSWKPYVLLQPEERYVLYFDSANIVVLRGLEQWFLTIMRNGYLVLSNTQCLKDITPSDYWSLIDIEAAAHSDDEVFGAGIVGFDRLGPAGDALRETLELTKHGWTLGCSPGEVNKVYDRSVIRDCPCFRADQTLLNLTFRKHIKGPLFVRKPHKYCGFGGLHDHPNQDLWYARKSPKSMMFLWRPLHRDTITFRFNRVKALPRIFLAPYKGRLVSLIRRLSSN